MKKKKADWQVYILFLLINVFLIAGSLLPLKEKIAYYTEKSDQIQLNINSLEKYKSFQKYHAKRYIDLSNEYQLIRKSWLKIKSENLESYFRKQQRHFKLDLKSQNVETVKAPKFFDHDLIQQELEGQFENIIAYLKMIYSDELPLILLEFELYNPQPKSKNPMLVATLKFGFFKI